VAGLERQRVRVRPDPAPEAIADLSGEAAELNKRAEEAIAKVKEMLANAGKLVGHGSGARRQHHQTRSGDDCECSVQFDLLFSLSSGSTPAACCR